MRCANPRSPEAAPISSTCLKAARPSCDVTPQEAAAALQAKKENAATCCLPALLRRRMQSPAGKGGALKAGDVQGRAVALQAHSVCFCLELRRGGLLNWLLGRPLLAAAAVQARTCGCLRPGTCRQGC